MVVYKTIDEANQAVVNKVIAGSPFLLDVVPAHTVIDEFNHGKLLLHAGPPPRSKAPAAGPPYLKVGRTTKMTPVSSWKAAKFS